MSVLKCKMCGGDVDLSSDRSLGTCQYCGTVQTIPKVSDEQRTAIFNRGNFFRRAGDFDKAIALYESLLREDDSDAEAHWCCALCRFGIEYVKDPATGDYIPTCHRAGFDSILEDVDYYAALAYSDPITREKYTADAQRIDEVRRNILSVSRSAEQYDVFICYKESDDQGHRTPDSVKAQELYTLLTDKGIRVFYARFSLEDKIGQMYEPYIFAALHSAKVMLLVASQPAYVEAVWVKNEWSRFLSLMKKDPSRAVIPCCYNMPAEAMPEQFARIQAVYLEKPESKVELLRAVDKLLDRDRPKAQTAAAVGGVNLDAYLKRVEIFLGDGDWENADEYCEKVLDQDPENGRAYLGKLLAGLHVRNKAALKQRRDPFDQGSAYQKALRYASAQDRKFLEECNREIRRRNEAERQDSRYRKALQLQDRGDYTAAEEIFQELGSYKDSPTRASACHTTHCLSLYNKAADLQNRRTAQSCKEAIVVYTSIPDYMTYKDAAQRIEDCREEIRRIQYDDAIQKMNHARTEQDYRIAARAFRTVPEYQQYRDASAQAQSCVQRADTLHEKAEAKLRKDQKRAKRKGTFRKWRKGLVICGIFLAIAAVIYYASEVKPGREYENAVALRDSGQYPEAMEAFSDLGSYKDAAFQLQKTAYLYAEELEQDGEPLRAAIFYGKAGDYEDAREKSNGIWSEHVIHSTMAGCGSHMTAIKADGTIYNTGDASVSHFEDIIDLAGGYAGAIYGGHAVGLKSDGTVVTAGPSSFGQCNVSDWTNIVDVAAGCQHTVGLRNDGTVLAVGRNADSQLNVQDWENVVLIGAGSYHTVAMTADGKMLATGSNSYGQCDISGWTDIIAMDGSEDVTAGLRKDGTVVVAGNSTYDVSGWTDIVAIDAAGSWLVGLRADGTVVVTGGYVDVDVSGWSGIVAVMTDGLAVVGVKADGSVIVASTQETTASQWTGLYVPERFQ